MSGELKKNIMEMTPASLNELERLATKAENEATRLGAIKEILDRGYGRPGQQVNLDITHYDRMNEDQLRDHRDAVGHHPALGRRRY